MPRRQARDVETGGGLVWTELRKGVPSCAVVSFPSRPQRIISVPVSKAELAQQLLELCRSHSSFSTEDLKKLCRDQKRSLANTVPSENSKKDITCSEKPGKPTQKAAVSAVRSKDSKKNVRCNEKPTQTTAVRKGRSKDSKKSTKLGEELSKTTQIDAVMSATSADSQRGTEDIVGGEEHRKTTEIDGMKSATSTDAKKHIECGKKLSEKNEAGAVESAPCRDLKQDTECRGKPSKEAQVDSMAPVLSKDSKANIQFGEVNTSSLHKKRIEVDAPPLREQRKKAKPTNQANLERWFQRRTCSPLQLSQCQGSSSSADLSLTQMLGEVMDMDESIALNQQAPNQAGDGAEIPLTQMLTEIMMDMSQELVDVSHPSKNAGQCTETCTDDPNAESSISTGKVSSFGKPRRRRGKGKDTRKLGRHSLEGHPTVRSKNASQTTLVF